MALKILVVDDDKTVRKLFTDLFKKENHIVKSAPSGEEAIAIIKDQDFDAVILDIKLEGISGLDTLQKIKELKPNTAVIMVTGFGYDQDLIAKSKELGSSGYISKDLPINQIINNFKSFVMTAKEKEKT